MYREKLRELNLGLEDRLTTKVGLLSGGQRQAVTLLMASLQKPRLLLLDEHTAALDPATAAKVLELSDSIVRENGLIMMNNGKIIFDCRGEEKAKLTVEDLLEKFAQISGSTLDSDRALLN